MTTEQKQKLEQTYEFHAKEGTILREPESLPNFLTGAQTILDAPGEWGLQEIPDYYCAEKDRIGYVCEDGPCKRCELVIQQDAVATRNELIVESEREIMTLQSQLSRYREFLDERIKYLNSIDLTPFGDGRLSGFEEAKEALKQHDNETDNTRD